MLNLDERSLHLRHEGHEMKLKFMTPTQASKDPHKLKQKIEKEEILTGEGRTIEAKEKEVKKKMIEKVVQKLGV